MYFKEEYAAMLELRGRYNTAKVFTDNIEHTAISQIINLCNQGFTRDCKIRIMPDCHAGTGCVIGFTADLGDIVIPNLVGVDIGCGMYVVELGKIEVDLPKLDYIIHQYIPSGTKVHEEVVARFPELLDLYCYTSLKDMGRIKRSIGTLGGGNHFIELDIDDEENVYLVIHSGSRNLGKQVADLYQHLATDRCSGKENFLCARDALINEYKRQGQQHLIQSALENLKNDFEHWGTLSTIKTYAGLMVNPGEYTCMICKYANVTQL